MRRLLPTGLLGLGLLAIAGAVALVGHFYLYAAEAGFELAQVAPCLVSASGICSFQLCASRLAQLSNHASEVFWIGVGLASGGLFFLAAPTHPQEPR